jgi:hypothetical protein
VAYTYDEIFAKDPSNPEVVAQSATITIFDPADATKAPVPIFDVTGSPLPNPITVNAQGMGPAFSSPTLDRVGWFGAGFQNWLTSYEGMRLEAQAAKTNALSSANAASSSLSAALAAQAAAELAASTSTGGGMAVDPEDADALLITTKTDGTVIIDPADADALLITT